MQGCVKWAKEHNVTLITEKEMAIINEERKKNQPQILKNKNWIIFAFVGLFLCFIIYHLYRKFLG